MQKLPRGKGMSRGHFQPTFSKKNALKRCKMKKDTDNVVLIDVDSDNFDEVIIIDGLESLQQKSRGPSVLREGKKPPLSNIISIDDDKCTDNDHPGVGLEGRGDLDNDSNLSKRSNSASNHSWSSVGADGDECQFIRKSYSSSGKAPCRNRYGLSTESESDSSESDCSDCEVMEGSSGRLREQWEKAFTKRKYNARNDQSGLEDQASASGSPGDAHPVFEVKNSCELHPEVPVCSCSSDASYEKESSFVATDDGDLGGTSINPELGNPFAQFNCTVDQERFSWCKAESIKTRHNLNGKCSDWFRGESSSEWPPFSYGGSTFQYEEAPNFQGPNLSSDQDQDDKRCNNEINFQGKARKISGEPCEFNSNPSIEIRSDQSETNVQGKKASSFYRQHQNETQARHGKVGCRNKDEEFIPGHSRCDTHSLNEVRCEISNSGIEEKAVPSAAPSEGEVRSVPEDGFCSVPLWSKEVDNEYVVCQSNKKSIFEESSMGSTQHNETHGRRSYQVEGKEPEFESNQPEDESNGPVCGQEGVVTPAVEFDIINERERLKETEEYKRAIEEEWASRQRELQIQAEEAQRLRKRRRAESMRLLDMERRQKQRLEEVRATQKQDEENINLKEQLRVGIRKELYKLEMTCIDMASVLRGLGIHVGGGVYPSPHEVHTAYKRALLRFHPDRASRNNLRQQVEAEEKFKLMSRMKEKLLWTS